jgi:S1-C subfamily serine protease
VLTIGYLMVEAYAAEIITNDGHTVPATVVGYDNDTGFGLLRATEPLRAKATPLGRSGDVKIGDVVAVASGGGTDMVSAVTVVSKRQPLRAGSICSTRPFSPPRRAPNGVGLR